MQIKPKSYFMSRVKINPVSKCWEWQLSCNIKSGYASCGIGSGKMKPAHRIAYMTFIGKISPGMHVLHKCDNRKCVNPDHLFLGTNKDNIRDKCAKGRQARNKLKLTASDVVGIRFWTKLGYTNKVVGRTYGVNPATVCRIANRIWWQDVP